MRNPFSRKGPVRLKNITDADVIAIAKQLGDRVTASSLATYMHLNIKAAEKRLKKLSKKGVFYTTVNDNSRIYILTNANLIQTNHIPQLNQKKPSSAKEVSDSEVILAAVKTQGRISPGMLCMATQLSVEEAGKKLMELQHKGVFDIEATPDGGLVYLLKDWDSYQHLLGKS